MGLLRSMIVSRLGDLRLGLSDAELRELADRFISDANDISGDIVLRAAQRGTSASELIGVVLSRHIVRHEIGASQLAGLVLPRRLRGLAGPEGAEDRRPACPEPQARARRLDDIARDPDRGEVH